MGNHTEVRVGGWTPVSPLSSTEISQLQTRVVKSPNGDDGSDHNGSCSFGGLRAPHMTNTPTLITTAASSTPVATLDLDLASNFVVVVSAFAGDQTLAITVDNPRPGDRGTLHIRKANGPTRNLTMTIAGASGFVAAFDDGHGYVDNDAASDAITSFALEAFDDPSGDITVLAKNLGTRRSL